MLYKKHKTKKGFTLIELLVVVAIIGLLSSVVLASLNSARGKAQDARRKSDLKQIQIAIELYYDKCGTYIVRQNCTGTAYGSGGVGWFNYLYSGSAGTVAKGLVDNDVVGGEIIDPSGMISSNAVDRSGYMIQATASKYTLWANLKNPTTADIATQDTCSISSYDNYSSTYASAARMNYCVGN